MKNLVLLLLSVASFLGAQSQWGPFAPHAGHPNSTAIHRDSVVFVAWASECTLQLGKQDISNSAAPLVSTGTSAAGVGRSDGDIVSLGDGGIATLKFETPIFDRPGYDFAVFENGFVLNTDDGRYFLELAHVEVSSNGVDFVRFPSASVTDTGAQVGPFEGIIPDHVNNLAGKYESAYGTPFDLQELSDSTAIDVNSITHVRIIDVVGSINNQYASRDSQNNKINDPWPTDFASSGFDLDAVGVLNMVLSQEEKTETLFRFYPNPANDIISFDYNIQSTPLIAIYTANGQLVRSMVAEPRIDISDLPKGLYFIEIEIEGTTSVEKLIKQ